MKCLKCGAAIMGTVCQCGFVYTDHPLLSLSSSAFDELHDFGDRVLITDQGVWIDGRKHKALSMVSEQWESLLSSNKPNVFPVTEELMQYSKLFFEAFGYQKLEEINKRSILIKILRQYSNGFNTVLTENIPAAVVDELDAILEKNRKDSSNDEQITEWIKKNNPDFWNKVAKFRQNLLREIIVDWLSDSKIYFYSNPPETLVYFTEDDKNIKIPNIEFCFKQVDKKSEYVYRTNGYYFDRGYQTEDMPDFLVELFNEKTERMENVRIFITQLDIVDADTARTIIDLAAPDEDMLIIANTFSEEALTMFRSANNRTAKCEAVMAPGYGERRRAMLNDIAVLTGTNVMPVLDRRTLSNMDSSILGLARDVVVEPKRTIIAGCPKRKEYSDYIVQLRKQYDQTSSEYDRERLAERLRIMSKGVRFVWKG